MTLFSKKLSQKWEKRRQKRKEKRIPIMNNGTINETEVRKWFDIMRAGNELTEVRIKKQ